MLSLAKESSKAFNNHFIGKTLDVLWEQHSGSVWSGLTGNYIKVYTGSNNDLANIITPVKLVRPYRDGLYGEV